MRKKAKRTPLQIMREVRRKQIQQTVLGEQIISGLQELLEVMQSGEPLEDHFKTTAYHEDGRVTRTTPKKRKK